jgi:hypothetical protein
MYLAAHPLSGELFDLVVGDGILGTVKIHHQPFLRLMNHFFHKSKRTVHEPLIVIVDQVNDWVADGEITETAQGRLK